MSARDQVFETIRQALAPISERAGRPEVPAAIADPIWLDEDADVVDAFRDRLVTTGGLFFDAPASCGQWLAAENVQRLYVAPELADLLPALNCSCPITHEYSRTDVDSIDAAITSAAGAIAESGTFILTDATLSDRLSALAPWRHVAVVRRDMIFRTIGEALQSMPDDPNIVWVTGPSKTADVEGILIQGVHGPGQQGCLVI